VWYLICFRRAWASGFWEDEEEETEAVSDGVGAEGLEDLGGEDCGML
jgi:hypothetical protein